MGFRSVLISHPYRCKLSDEFLEKYSKYYTINSGLIITKYALKFYDAEFFEDLQKAIDWKEFGVCYKCCLLHEDGVITKVKITKADIKYKVFFDDVGEDSYLIWMGE